MKKTLFFILCLLTSFFAQAQTKTVDNVAGDLANRLTQEEKDNLTELILKGTMDAADFSVINLMKKIQIVNMRSVSKVTDDRIPDGAFANNATISSVVLPPSVTAIGDRAFMKAGFLKGDALTVLKSVEVTGNLTSIGGSAFQRNASLTSFPFQASLKEIGSSAFDGSGITSLDLSATKITALLGNTFLNCANVKSIKWPAGIKSIGVGAFQGSGLEGDLVIPNTVTSIVQNVFQSTKITSVVLPEGLESIPVGIFQNCKSLTTVKIPESVNEINVRAFTNTGMESIKLPEGLASIRQTAFSNSRLKTIELPAGLVIIEGRAFENSASLTSVIVHGVEPIDLSDLEEVFDGIPSTATLYVPAGSVSKYKAAAQWSNFANIKAIGSDAVAGDITDFANIIVEKGSAAINLTATATGGRPVTFSIEAGKDAVAKIAGNVLTIVGEGTAQITAKAAGDNNYQESTKTITLNVVDYAWLEEVAIAVLGNKAKVVGKKESAAKFTKFFINDTEVELKDGMADLTNKNGELSLKATTADGTEVIKLKIDNQ